jgi:hypothetical protein
MTLVTSSCIYRLLVVDHPSRPQMVELILAYYRMLDFNFHSGGQGGGGESHKPRLSNDSQYSRMKIKIVIKSNLTCHV